MVKLLIIADDITGALDTGAQFVSYGITPVLLVQREVKFDHYADGLAEVLVMDVETRHVGPEEAYQVVHGLVEEAVKAGVQYVYKKTDSGLRGNICSELCAVLDASGRDFLAFLPAFPKMNRITVNGTQYIDGIPLKESVYGRDPFDPVASSYIPELFVGTKDRVRVFEKTDNYSTCVSEKTIGIFDAKTDGDLDKIVCHLMKKEQLAIMAGCAGGAAALNRAIGFKRCWRMCPKLDRPFLVICGSVSPVSKAQVEYAQMHGFQRLSLSVEQQLKKEYLQSKEGEKMQGNLLAEFRRAKHCIIDTKASDIGNAGCENIAQVRKEGMEIAASLGRIVGGLLKSGLEKTLMIIGGDTLLGLIKSIDCGDIQIVCELNDGMVLSRISIQGRHYWLISKSGSFGSRELLVRLAEERYRGGIRIEQESV